MKTLSTEELMERVLNGEPTEATLRLGVFNATHWLSHDGVVLYDEGIDGEMRETTVYEFLEEYPNATWVMS